MLRAHGAGGRRAPPPADAELRSGAGVGVSGPEGVPGRYPTQVEYLLGAVLAGRYRRQSAFGTPVAYTLPGFWLGFDSLCLRGALTDRCPLRSNPQGTRSHPGRGLPPRGVCGRIHHGRHSSVLRLSETGERGRQNGTPAWHAPCCGRLHMVMRGRGGEGTRRWCPRAVPGLHR